jgi:hypothetical protein
MMKERSIALLTAFLFGGASAFAEMDDAGLKERLAEYYFCAGHDSAWQEFDTFKKQHAVSDEQLHRVLMDIYREAGVNRPALAPQSDEWKRNQGMAESVVRWLPKCGNVPVKEFLLDRMTTKEPDGHIRKQAILAYLRAADAEEAKNVLLRFLVGNGRLDLGGRSSICRYAQTAFMDADAAKRAAILESLYVALSREENKCNFQAYDDVLCDLSNDYANSRQRFAILQKLINAPPLCKADEYVMPDLTEKLKELRRTRRTININTNLAVVMSRDFNLPQPEVQTGGTSGYVPEGGNDESEASVPPPSRPLRPAVPLAVGAGLLAAFALWRGRRKKKS